MDNMKLNLNRAKRFSEHLFNYGPESTAIGCLTDFLTDARHWCDWHSQSFAEIDEQASQHYLGELRDAKVSSQ